MVLQNAAICSDALVKCHRSTVIEAALDDGDADARRGPVALFPGLIIHNHTHRHKHKPCSLCYSIPSVHMTSPLQYPILLPLPPLISRNQASSSPQILYENSSNLALIPERSPNERARVKLDNRQSFVSSRRRNTQTHAHSAGTWASPR